MSQTSPGVFSATMSYHTMLKRAQELDPVLTYALCKLLTEAKVKPDRDFVDSEHVNVDHTSHPFSAFFMRDDMDRFVKEIFFNMTVTVSCSIIGDRDQRVRYLSSRKEFVRWLQSVNLTFDHDAHFVSIPA